MSELVVQRENNAEDAQALQQAESLPQKSREELLREIKGSSTVNPSELSVLGKEAYRQAVEEKKKEGAPEPKEEISPEKEQSQPTNTGLEFMIDRLIGEGGFAKVYEATLSTGRKVAVKIPHDDKSAKHLVSEAKLQADLSNPNIVTIEHVTYDDENKPVVIMPLLKGALDTAEQRSVEECLEIIMQVASGLKYAHSRGVIHRDIKPANILQKDDTIYLLADFGLADSIDHIVQSVTFSGTVSPAVRGTIRYMAPEVFDGKPATSQSDIYGLTAILYELLTNRKFGPGYESAMEEKNVPEDVRAIVKKGLEENLEKRYKSCDELLQDIESIVRKQRVTQDALFEELAKRVRIYEQDNGARIKGLQEHALALYNHFGKCTGNGRTVYALRFLYQNKLVRFTFNKYDKSLLFFGIDADWDSYFVKPFKFYSLQTYTGKPELLFCTEDHIGSGTNCEKYFDGRLRSSPVETVNVLKWCYAVIDIAEAALTMQFLNEIRYAQRKKCEPFAQWKQTSNELFLTALAEFDCSFLQLKEYASRTGIEFWSVLDTLHSNIPIILDTLIMKDTGSDKAVVLQNNYSLSLILNSNSLIVAKNGIKVFVPNYANSQAHLDYLVMENRSYTKWFGRGDVIISHMANPALEVEQCVIEQGDKVPVPFETGSLEALKAKKMEGKKIYSPSLVSAEQPMTGNVLVFAFDSEIARQALADVGKPDCPIKKYS